MLGPGDRITFSLAVMPQRNEDAEERILSISLIVFPYKELSESQQS